jgi:hypothetical protein
LKSACGTRDIISHAWSFHAYRLLPCKGAGEAKGEKERGWRRKGAGETKGPEKERGWRRKGGWRSKGAGEAKGPEKQRGRSRKGAGETKGPEKQRGWRRKEAGEAKGPEKQRGRRSKGAGEAKGLEKEGAGALRSRQASVGGPVLLFLVVAIYPVCLGRASSGASSDGRELAVGMLADWLP